MTEKKAYHTPQPNIFQYLKKPSVLAGLSEYLRKGEHQRDLQDMGNLGLAHPKLQYYPLPAVKSIYYKNKNPCANLYKTIERLRIDEIEGIINGKIASFREEFQTFMEHLQITNPPPYDEAVESAYPLVAWLREYELQIPESWNEDLEYNLIDYFVMNLPDALHKLRNANGVMLKSDIEFKKVSHEFPDETEIIGSETYKKILISVCMAIHRCFPTIESAYGETYTTPPTSPKNARGRTQNKKQQKKKNTKKNGKGKRGKKGKKGK